MRVVIVNNGTKHLRALFRLVEGHDVSVIDVFRLQANAVPADALVILSGAKRGQAAIQGNDHYYAEELKLIKTHQGPLVGICFGFELIAHAYGVTLYRRQRRIRRLVRVVTSSLPAAQFLPRQFVAYVSHKFSVQAVQGDELIELARSHGGVEMLRHRTRPVLGMQFHPEVRWRRNRGNDIFKRVLKELTK